MPEEINRLVADKLSSAFFCVSQTAVRQLADEGITRDVYWTGKVYAHKVKKPLEIFYAEIENEKTETQDDYVQDNPIVD